jgi:DNA-binding CsgD family transcriptional regulator
VRLDLLDELRRAIGFDAYAWLLTDPETAVGSALLADVPCLSELPRLIRLKYLTTINRWTTLVQGEVGLLWAGLEGPSRSLVWRDLLSAYGVVDVASSVFRDRAGCWGFLDLWRTGPAARFNDDEAAFLAGIAAPVTSALRRAAASTLVNLSSPDRPRLGDDGDRGDIAVTIEKTSPDQRVSLFAKASALSPRESEVLGHVVSGSDTRQLAELLFISEHTVQDHFKSIFAKTGAHTRASLLSKVLGNGPSHGAGNLG